MYDEENARPEADIEELISSIPIDRMQVMIANNYINFDDLFQTKKVIVDEEAIIEEICQVSGSEDNDEDSDIEVEKISHSVTLKQCKLLLQYVEQQDPIEFVQEPDLPRLRSLLQRIQGEVTKMKRQTQLTNFF